MIACDCFTVDTIARRRIPVLFVVESDRFVAMRSHYGFKSSFCLSGEKAALIRRDPDRPAGGLFRVGRLSLPALLRSRCALALLDARRARLHRLVIAWA